MRKPPATIEWQIAADEREWTHWASSAAPVAQPARRLAGRWGEAVFLLLLLCAVGGWRWYTVRQTWLQTQAEVTTAIHQETGDVPFVHLLTNQGELALVQVAATADPQRRQVRLYQHTPAGWQWAPPTADLWGEPQQLTTPYVVWHYRAQDVAVVATVAPQIEALYATLRRHFALADETLTAPLAIEVSITPPPAWRAAWRVSGQIVVPTPALYRSPVGLTDAELIVQAVALPLLDNVIAQAYTRYQWVAPWQPMVLGLRLWQLWDFDLPLAAWQTRVVPWLYADSLRNDAAQPLMLPAGYADLCATHALWLTSPLQIGIPLLCTELDKAAWYTAVWGERMPPTRLAQLMAPINLAVPHQPEPYGQTVALATLLNYAVVTYGSERLPALVASLGQYTNWETLLPAVYGVSAAEFEAGWRRSLTNSTGQRLMR